MRVAPRGGSAQKWNSSGSQDNGTKTAYYRPTRKAAVTFFNLESAEAG